MTRSLEVSLRKNSKLRSIRTSNKCLANSILFGILQCSLKVVECVRVALKLNSLFSSSNPMEQSIAFNFPFAPVSVTSQFAAVPIAITILNRSFPVVRLFSVVFIFNDDRFGLLLSNRYIEWPTDGMIPLWFYRFTYVSLFLKLSSHTSSPFPSFSSVQMFQNYSMT